MSKKKKLNISEKIKSYEETVRFAEMSIGAKKLLVITLAASIIGFFLGALVDITLAILIPLVIIDIGIGMPFFLARRKVRKIETALPDMLHHMSTTLKTGGTVEVALEEASRVDYGPITKGIKRMLSDIREGSTFERAFKEFAIASRSELLEKTAMIIITARKSGGGLVDTLTAMSEDIRALERLRAERRTKTLLQFLFIVVAGCFVAPFVFGVVKSVLTILVSVGGAGTGNGLIARFDLIFKVYLIMESALTTLAAVQVREGSMSKAVIYIPILVLITYVIYVIVASQFLVVLGGTTTGVGTTVAALLL